MQQEIKEYNDVYHQEILKDYKEQLKSTGYRIISSKGNFKTGKVYITIEK